MINEREVLKAAGRSAITTFLHSQIAFELVRISGKVFDVLQSLLDFAAAFLDIPRLEPLCVVRYRVRAEIVFDWALPVLQPRLHVVANKHAAVAVVFLVRDSDIEHVSALQ